MTIERRQEYPYPRNLRSMEDIEQFLKKLCVALSAGQSALPEIIASATAPKVVIKTDTGDPATAAEGVVYINTFDNKVKIYADAGWRQLATW